MVTVQRDANNAISVVIPVYNRKDSLRECLLSVISQLCSFDEIVVIDDGSTEDITQEITDLLGEITLLSQVNKGAAAARNLGIKNSKSPWIMFLDSDDIWRPNRVEEFSRDLLHFDFDVHLSDILFTGLGYSASLFQIKQANNILDYKSQKIEKPLDLVLTGMSLIGAAIRRSSCAKINFLNEDMEIYEDTDFIARLALSENFTVNPSIVAEARRLEKDTNSLTGMETKNAVKAKTFWVTYLKNLRQLAKSQDEKKLINKKLSGSLLSLALVTKNKKLLVESTLTHPNIFKGVLKSVIGIIKPNFMMKQLSPKNSIYRG